MTKVHLIGTGGTIASRAGSGTTDGSGAVASDTVSDLLALGGESATTVTTEDLMTVGSYRLGLADMLEIATTALARASEPKIDGVVVTHGTDTLEETAFLTDLLHSTESPVVFTGAQRAADTPAPDGPRNLAQAIAVAADRRFQSIGTLVSFDGRVQSARGARKAHTTASQPFDGGTTVGLFRGDDLDLVARTSRPAPLPIPGPEFGSTRVDIVTAYPGSSPDALHHAVNAGASAIVLAGTGVGNAGPGYAEAVTDLTAANVPVILASRVLAGPVVPLYGNGGGVDLIAAGAESAGHLNPFQARILAAVLLAGHPSPSDFTTQFRALR